MIKAQLVRSLTACAHREDESILAAAEAAYQLTTCYVDGFGVQRNLEQAWQWMIKSARLGSLKARAQAYRLFSASLPKQNLLPDMKLEAAAWLQEAVHNGSTEAAQDLLSLDPAIHATATRFWAKRFCQVDAECLSMCNGADGLKALLSIPTLKNSTLNERGHHLIHVAASLGDIHVLQELLTIGVNIDSLNTRGESALLCACRAGEPKAASFLVMHGASVIHAMSGESPLHWLIAIQEIDIRQVASKLMEAGAQLEQQYTDNEDNQFIFDIYPCGTPLDWAVSKRYLAAVKILVEYGADPFDECSQFSAFTRAASAHDWELIQILLSSKHTTLDKLSGLESTGHSILFEAIYCYRPFTRLLIHGQDTKQAASNTIKLLLEAGCDASSLDRGGSSIMHVAAGFCDSEFVKMLLEDFQCQAYINKGAGEPIRTPIHQAIASGDIEVVKLLIEYGADTYVTINNHTLLHLLAANEDEAYSCLCLEALRPVSRSDLNALAISKEAPEGLTAFEYTIQKSHLKVAELLLRSGADPFAVKDRDLHFLASVITLPYWNSLQALQYYLDNVDSPFVMRTSTSLSVLHIAASMLHYLADSMTGEHKFDLLLTRFARLDRVNATNTSSKDLSVTAHQTPLHFAAKFGVFYAVRKLLLAGADPSATDDGGKTPLDIAQDQLTLLKARLMEHESIRAVSDLESTVKLLERPESLITSNAGHEASRETSLPPRFSRLGFETQPVDPG